MGSVGVAGSAGFASGTFTVRGAGADIWDNADAFHYLYQPLSGDGQITARVTSVQNTHEWAKAGVMIRETLAPNARHASLLVTPTNGLAFQRRTTVAGGTAHTGSTGGAPQWVRLVRSGNTISAAKSGDGVTWVVIGSEMIPMAASVYVGLAVTSHNDTALCTATFGSVTR